MSEQVDLYLNIKAGPEFSDSKIVDVSKKLRKAIKPHVSNIEIKERPGEEGSKGMLADFGSITLTLAPIVIPNLIIAIQAWLNTQSKRNLKIVIKTPGGKEIEIDATGYSTEELNKVIQDVSRIN